MAERQATRPSQTKSKPRKRKLRYKDAYDLRSASGWKAWNLKLLNAELDTNPGELRDVVGREYFPSDEDTSEFGQRINPSSSQD